MFSIYFNFASKCLCWMKSRELSVSECVRFEDEILHPLRYCGEIPEKLNNPFNYSVHPVCKAAVDDLVPNLKPFLDDDAEGKMFAVLIVKRNDNHSTEAQKLYYLAAFSGQLYDKSVIQGFVPPVFDLLDPDGYFKRKEKEISEMNKLISEIEDSCEYKGMKSSYESLRAKLENDEENFRAKLSAEKSRRDKMRSEQTLNEEEETVLRAESSFLKAEFKRMKSRNAAMLEEKRAGLEVFERKLSDLRYSRREESERLQRWIFSRYRMVNFAGASKNILEIFEDKSLGMPPAGTGDCCEPKLFQYAYLHGLVPVQIAMFWWGRSPSDIIRHYLSYYPACTGKCRPVLEYMLPGEVFSEPLPEQDFPLTVLYEDDGFWIVDKPSGMLSVPGKSHRTSVISRLVEVAEEGVTPLEVHRLDMDTSGVMVVAKSLAAQSELRKMFESRDVSKTYVAVLDGRPLEPGESGVINLPLSPDLSHRPFQKVDTGNGKDAVTLYRALGEHVVELRPLTGRTHQLRVHCAHLDGLGRPIRGDNLYGRPADRLHLHALRIEFLHPFTGEKIKVESKARGFI